MRPATARAVPLGDAANDRQAEAGALLAAVGAPVEAVEDALALGLRGCPARRRRPAAHAARRPPRRARRRASPAANSAGVVDQVADQRPRGDRVARDDDRLRRRRSSNSLPRSSANGCIAASASRASSPRSTGSSAKRRAGLAARQRQQLLDEASGAVDALAERLDRRRARGVVAGAAQQPQLQLQRRQRRAQLVRGVGDEGALAVERAAQALEQGVERARQRRDLVGQAGRRHRRERARVARSHLARRGGRAAPGSAPPATRSPGPRTAS